MIRVIRNYSILKTVKDINNLKTTWKLRKLICRCSIFVPLFAPQTSTRFSNSSHVRRDCRLTDRTYALRHSLSKLSKGLWYRRLVHLVFHLSPQVGLARSKVQWLGGQGMSRFAYLIWWNHKQYRALWSWDAIYFLYWWTCHSGLIRYNRCGQRKHNEFPRCFHVVSYEG
jgi:hypothetical protein